MTKGSPWRLIAGFALPVLLSQVFQQLYNTADTLIVGRFLGDGALAAVSSSGPLIFLLVSFVEGLTLGAASPSRAILEPETMQASSAPSIRTSS